MKKLIKKILIWGIFILLLISTGLLVVNYHKFKSPAKELEKFNMNLWFFYSNYTWVRGHFPTDGNEYLNYIKKEHVKVNGYELYIPKIVEENGLHIDIIKGNVIFYISNKKNIKQYNNAVYIHDVDSVNFYNYSFKPLKIVLFRTDKLLPT